jgi:hypothetical protein
MLFKLLTFYSLLTTGFATIKDCNPESIFRPTQLTVYPDPPIPGQPVKLTLIFDNTGPKINDGTVTTTLSINSMPFSPSTQTLCDNTKCPIVSGSNNRSTENIWPNVNGIVKSKITWTGPNNEQLLCINTVFKIPSSNFWDIFSSIKKLYHDNKNEIKLLFSSLNAFADRNNLRGILGDDNTEKIYAPRDDDTEIQWQ